MQFHETKIAGLYIVETHKIGDERGHFSRIYCQDALKKCTEFSWQPVQINHSFSKEKGTLRGLHFQNAPALEAKMVRCTKGKVFDVAVDLRADSPTFLQHVSVELSGENGLALLIPAGCAHGFQTMTDDCEMLYLHSAAYAKEHEGGVRFDDPTLAIDWPLPPTIVSERDKSFALLNENFKGIADAL